MDDAGPLCLTRATWTTRCSCRSWLH